MSNILIIKHGSLGDIAQSSGAMQDIYENHQNDDIYLLTSKPYVDLFKKNKFIKDIILDRRLSRFNLIYLLFLMKKIKKLNFYKVYDLQNSSRTAFYKKILFPKSDCNKWSSSLTTLPVDKTKEEFDKISVLERFNHQLNVSGISTKYTKFPNFDWACCNIDKLKHNFNLKNYIILFPFCSPHLSLKRWPYYKELIQILKKKYNEKYKIIIAPGPQEIKESKNFDVEIIMNNKEVINISELASLIKHSSFVVANDTGPAHIAAHLGVKGLALFGNHTSAYKVSIEREKFKSIQVADLKKLTPEKVSEKIFENLD